MSDDVLKDLIKTRSVLKNKYKTLVLGQTDKTNQLEETFKPITKPIQELLEHNKLKSNNNNNLKNVKFDIDELKYLKKPKIDSSTPVKKPYTLGDDDVELNDPSLFVSFDSNNIDQNNSTENAISTVNSAASSSSSSLNDISIQNLSNLKRDNKLDLIYGLHKDDNGTWKFGNTSFSINNEKIHILNQNWNLTPGLFELLFHKYPKNYDSTDVKIYKKILINSNAHRRDFLPNGQIKGTRSKKYKTIIKKLIYGDVDDVRSKNVIGSGIMRFTEAKPNYLYWDDPNELIDRLRLLISSQLAGHNNHDNEIVSIIEELIEADIII